MNYTSFEKAFPMPNIRPKQKEILSALNKIYSAVDSHGDPKYKYIVIEAGTGIGKSAIANAIATNEPLGAYVVTTTKQLVSQYDFKNARVVNGRSNYQCPLENVICSEAKCITDPDISTQCNKLVDSNGFMATTKQPLCPYLVARKKASHAQMCVTNSAYFLTMSQGIFKPRGSVIIDECHLLEDILLEASGFTLNFENLKNIKVIPTKITDIKELALLHNRKPNPKIYMPQIKLIRELIKKRILVIENDVEFANSNRSMMTADQLTIADSIPTAKLINQYTALKTLMAKVDKFLAQQENEKLKENWVVTVDDKRIAIKPLDIKDIFKHKIASMGQRVIFMSATILDKVGFCNDLGLDKEHTCFITKTGEFDPLRSPVVYKPIGSMSYKNVATTMPFMIEEVKKILRKHSSQKGIIHTGNYNICKALYDALEEEFGNRLLYKQEIYSNDSLIREHINSDKPTVLLSPSLMTGVDLKDEDGRFSIVVKLPFLSLADARVKKKSQLNKNWYTYKMLRSLIQECGRTTRSSEDWSVTYVLDNLFGAYYRMFPEDFKKRIVKSIDLNKYYKYISENR